MLAQDSSYFDARYNLALLAQSIGATEEAKHSYEKLRAAHAPQAMLDRLQLLLK